MYAAKYFNNLRVTKHYALNAKINNVRCEHSLALLKIGHLFLSIFAERCHFFSGFLLHFYVKCVICNEKLNQRILLILI